MLFSILCVCYSLVLCILWTLWRIKVPLFILYTFQIYSHSLLLHYIDDTTYRNHAQQFLFPQFDNAMKGMKELKKENKVNEWTRKKSATKNNGRGAHLKRDNDAAHAGKQNGTQQNNIKSLYNTTYKMKMKSIADTIEQSTKIALASAEKSKYISIWNNSAEKMRLILFMKRMLLFAKVTQRTYTYPSVVIGIVEKYSKYIWFLFCCDASF